MAGGIRRHWKDHYREFSAIRGREREQSDQRLYQARDPDTGTRCNGVFLSGQRGQAEVLLFPHVVLTLVPDGFQTERWSSMKTIRKIFYLASAWAAGACLIVMTLLIMAQIIARMIGVVIPSSEDFAGWILSATIFFGLAYTFNSGGHIRVTLMLNRLSAKTSRAVEMLNIIVGMLIAGYLAFYTAYTVYESYDYGDVTDTYLAVPLWWVQLPMALGSVWLFVALVDGFSQMLRGQTPDHVSAENG